MLSSYRQYICVKEIDNQSQKNQLSLRGNCQSNCCKECEAGEQLHSNLKLFSLAFECKICHPKILLWKRNEK